VDSIPIAGGTGLGVTDGDRNTVPQVTKKGALTIGSWGERATAPRLKTEGESSLQTSCDYRKCDKITPQSERGGKTLRMKGTTCLMVRKKAPAELRLEKSGGTCAFARAGRVEEHYFLNWN